MARCKESIGKGPDRENSLKKAEHHLAATIQHNPSNRIAREMLGKFQLKSNDFASAAEHLKVAAEGESSLELTLARTYLRLKKRELAEEAAKRALKLLMHELETPPDHVGIRLKIVDAALIVGNYRRCQIVLADGIERFVKRPVDSSPSEPDRSLENETSDKDKSKKEDTKGRQQKLPKDKRTPLKILSASLSRFYKIWSTVIWPTDTKIKNLSVDQEVAHQERKQKAVAEAENAISHYLKKTCEEPRNILRWIRLAELEVLLHRYEGAAKHLAEALSYSHDDQLRQRLAAVHIDWAVAIVNNTLSSPSDKLEGLLRAQKHAPQHEVILTELAYLTGLDSTVASKARLALQEVLEKDQAPYKVHFILGNNAMLTKEHSVAKGHFLKANALSPGNAVVLNNLAWLHSVESPIDLDRALSFANEAVKKFNNPEIRETRGQILLKMKRWKESIEDLKQAVTAFPKRQAVHESLSMAYQALNQPDLAQKHRQQANELRTSTQQ